MTVEVIIAVVVAALWGASEVMADIPEIKSNSVFQLVRNVLKGLVEKDDKSG